MGLESGVCARRAKESALSVSYHSIRGFDQNVATEPVVPISCLSRNVQLGSFGVLETVESDDLSRTKFLVSSVTLRENPE